MYTLDHPHTGTVMLDFVWRRLDNRPFAPGTVQTAGGNLIIPQLMVSFTIPIPVVHSMTNYTSQWKNHFLKGWLEAAKKGRNKS